MRLRSLFIIAGILTALTGANAQEFTPGSAESREYLIILENIRTEYPPESSLVIGIGRSPWIWIDGLRIMRPESNWAFHLPLSDFRFLPNDPEGEMPSLSRRQELALFEYFDRLIPAEAITRGRQIVLLDYTTGEGSSIRAAQAYLQRYLSARRRPERIRTAVLHPARHRVPAVDDNIPLRSAEGSMGMRLTSQVYDSSAPHDSATIDTIAARAGGAAPALSPVRAGLYRVIRHRIHSLLHHARLAPEPLLPTPAELAPARESLIQQWRNSENARIVRAQSLLLLTPEQYLDQVYEALERPISYYEATSLLDSTRRYYLPERLPIFRQIIQRAVERFGGSPNTIAEARRLLRSIRTGSPEGAAWVATRPLAPCRRPSLSGTVRRLR